MRKIAAATNSMRLQFAVAAWRRLITQSLYKVIFDRIGSGTVIFSPGLLANTEFVRLGKRVLVRYGARIEVVLHGQAWRPALTIGDNVNIEQNVHIVCHDSISIGNNVSIAGHCAIVDVTHPVGAIQAGHKMGVCIDPARSKVNIGENSFIGFGAIVLPNVTIGRNCVVGAGSVVTGDVPDGAIVAGAPARVIGNVAGSADEDH
jgi:acetyltransferase-like isoleucine patch superfamily enzyme